MARHGLNATLSYPAGKTKRAYRLRVGSITYGHQMVAEETQARQYKAFYPHKTAPSQFGLQVLLVGYRERRSLNNWLMRYVDYILDPTIQSRRTPTMTVNVPSRNFRRIGVPVGGYEFGDHLGLMAPTPTLTFETSAEPMDWDDQYQVSRVFDTLSETRMPETEYFYPTGTQLAGEEVPSTYEVQNAVSGEQKGPSLGQLGAVTPVIGPVLSLLDELSEED